MLRLKARVQTQSTMIMCQTANISASGLFLVHKTILPVGTVFTFELLLPGAKTPIAGKARVVRHALIVKEKYEGMGATFIDLSPEDQERLREFVAGAQAGGGR
jgi:uncharacterized protein (TIGR02266 family)